MRRALHDQRQWTAAGLDWTVSVNVSARNLESADFADLVQQLLAEADAAPRDLCVEVTETALAFDAERAAGRLDALAACGIAISVDDFGTGFTGLSQLRTLAGRGDQDRPHLRQRARPAASTTGPIVALGHRARPTGWAAR